MKPSHRALLAVLVLAALLAAGWYLRQQQALPASQARIACSDLRQPCAITVAGQRYWLQASPAPVALQPFELSLTGSQLAAGWRVRFGMQGMEMGPIAFPLQARADGSLAARVVLPYCVQGRHDWWLRLEHGPAQVDVAFRSQS